MATIYRNGFPKTERNRRIYQYRLEHPKTTLEKIGKMFKLSKQAVSVIIRRENKKNGGD